MATFTIARGDTSPAIRYALPEGVILTGATVVFNVRGLLTRAPAEVVSDTGPIVQYGWQDGDTDQVGLHLAEFEVTYADGRVETFPTGDRLAVHIVSDLG